jgi:hypothetical protein
MLSLKVTLSGASMILTGRRLTEYKYPTTASNRLLAGNQHTENCMGTKTFSDLG